MKNIIKHFLFFISLLFFLECSNKPPYIYYLESTHFARFYVINNYKDNENCLKYIFNFSTKERGWFYILTDKNGAEFEANGLNNIDITKQHFSFNRIGQSLKNKYIKVNFLKNTPISFIIKKENNQTFLSSDFETLTVNTVQNFLDYAEKDDSKKETENYTYILYNKDNQEKMKLKYHDKGAWFEVEIL